MMKLNHHQHPCVTATVLLLLCLCQIASAQNIKGPPQIVYGMAKKLIMKEVGEPVKLTCPATASHSLIVQWEKDGERIDESWPEFRTEGQSLRIKSATTALSGSYRCTAINGFGSVEYEIKLLVIDPHDSQFSSSRGGVAPGSGNEYPSLTSREIQPSAPKITQMYPPQSRILKMAGGKVRLKCTASGTPKPAFTWLKDGVETSVGMVSVTGDLVVTGQLTLTQLTPADSGIYQCRAHTILGEDTAQFHITVDEPFGQKPEIMGSDPQNTTVSAGDQVSLQCRVKGQSPMHLKWLKRIEPHDTKAPRNATVAIEMLNGDRYQVLNVSDMVRSRPDEFLIKLTLSSARSSESGQYVCLAANNGGFTFRKAYLVVRDTGVSSFFNMSGDNVYLLVFVPVLLIVLLALTAVFCLCRRNRAREAQVVVKSDAEAGLMEKKKGAVQPHRTRLKPAELTAVSYTPRAGGPESSAGSSQCGNGRRYEPLSQQPPPDTQSGSSGSAQSCRSCGLEPQPHHHKHLHYPC